MNLRKQHVTGLTIAALFLATGSLIHAQEQKPFSPASSNCARPCRSGYKPWPTSSD